MTAWGNAGLYIPFATAKTLNVIITSPANGSTVTDAQFRVTWTLDTLDAQATYRLIVYSNSATLDSSIVYDSGTVASSALSAMVTLPGGLPNSGQLYIVVEATDTFGLFGRSDKVIIIVSWATSVNVSNVRSDAFGGCGDPVTLPAIRIRWNQVTPGTGETFLRYEIWRRDPDVSTTYTRMAMISAVDTLTWTDTEVESGHVYTYAVLWIASVGVETRVSAYPTAPTVGYVLFDYTWIHDQADPTKFVRFDAFDATLDVQQNIAFQRTWGSLAPVMRIGDQQSRVVHVTGLPEREGYNQQWDKLLALVTRQRTAASLLVCRFGAHKELLYCQASNTSKAQTLGSYSSPLDLVEVRHEVGV